jgi:hypothetical protein
MKKFLVILFSIFTLSGFSATYYVAPSGGSDDNAGTIVLPWATWQKAFDTAEAGDTVYFRGGIWRPTSEPILNPSISHGHIGTYVNPICFFNYSDEVPILDCEDYTSEDTKVAVDIKNTSYVKFRGLTIRNCYQIVTSQWISGFSCYQNENIYLDRMTVYNIEGYGIWVIEFDTLYVTNCDSYDNISSNDAEPGNRADGFTFGSNTPTPDSSNFLYVSGCRAWGNSDDGFEMSPACQTDLHNNWAFDNGHLTYGAGVGFKYGAGNLRTTSKRRTYNNLAAFNKGQGFTDQNLLYELGPVGEFSNNTAYKCEIGFGSDPGVFDCTTDYADVVYRNNLVYGSRWYSVQTYLTACAYDYPTYASFSHNTWVSDEVSPYSQSNDTITVTDADFVLIDSVTGINQMLAARGSDGSLPTITFLHLATGSDLINAGTDVGLSYNGVAPDIGFSEYGSTAIPAITVGYVTIESNRVIFRTNITSDGGTTITARGFCVSESENPEITDTCFDIDGTTGKICRIVSIPDELDAETTYYIRSYATNSEGTAYGTQVQFTTE